ncbi:MAG TPA: DUF6457 domain-containing protein, partial [Actinomycetes bacterium]|nr:DUF6457 domain-containing protein [Actinomycetes bacterium]
EAVACRRGPRLEPLVAVYQRAPALAAAGALLDAGTDRSLRALLAVLATSVIEEQEWRRADPDGASFVDLDDPADLAAFLEHPGGWEHGSHGTGALGGVRGGASSPPNGTGNRAKRFLRRTTVEDGTMEEFIERIRSLLGPDAPSVGEGEIEAVLELARVAAHASERRAAPVTTYLIGMAVAGAAPEAREAFMDDLVVKLEAQR